jgi:hypothetical protein
MTASAESDGNRKIPEKAPVLSVSPITLQKKKI